MMLPWPPRTSLVVTESKATHTISCTRCLEIKFLPYRIWTDPEKKLEILENFIELHELCEQARIRELKLVFFSLPYRKPRARTSY